MNTFLGRDKYDWLAMSIVTSIAFTIASLCHGCNIAHAQPSPRYSLGSASQIDYNSLADSIYQAEGGMQGEAYGIHSVAYSSVYEARAICLRTCQHNYQHWASNSKSRPYLEYLSKHYCPKHSKRWLKNVKWFYNKNVKQKENAI